MGLGVGEGEGERERRYVVGIGNSMVGKVRVVWWEWVLEFLQTNV